MPESDARNLMPGDAFAFPIGDGRYSVCRILLGTESERSKRWDGNVVLAACSAWIGDSIPKADDPNLRPILVCSHHFWNNSPVLVWTREAPPENFIPIGEIPPTLDERKIVCDSYGRWQSLTLQPLAQWRWDHDREAVLADDARKRQSETEQRLESRKNRKSFLRGITLEDLREHIFFPKWKIFPSAEAVEASRRIMGDTVDRLLDLGVSPSSKERMAILRECIEAFNELDAEQHCIETVEREDICSEFETIVHACGMGKHKDLADKWRDW